MKKEEIYQYLKEHNIQFEVTEHDAVFNMEELTHVELPNPDGMQRICLLEMIKRKIII